MHALLLAAIGLWCFLVALAGGLAGLVLGNIRLPALLFASSNPAAAGGAHRRPRRVVDHFVICACVMLPLIDRIVVSSPSG